MVIFGLEPGAIRMYYCGRGDGRDGGVVFAGNHAANWKGEHADADVAVGDDVAQVEIVYLHRLRLVSWE
ncbi:hypothetical protein EYC84_008997 [Monilinia fructicola]|uniref:Uncharacterized protein n=1 Tax=Monilinia fructicola TaxID=38448 RepID=A0A5M9JDJ7_MONFR|nr:hypothetical protein EYC84_008997 [Monilinia fructicola]